MKAYKIACLAAVASIAYAGGASAASFSPPTTAITFVGPITFKSGGSTLNCTATLNGTIDPTGALITITSASFSGGPLGICSAITATNLPWTIIASTTTSVTIHGVAVNTPISNCSPSDVSSSWANGTPSSTMSFTNQPLTPNCSVTASLKVAGVILVP